MKFTSKILIAVMVTTSGLAHGDEEEEVRGTSPRLPWEKEFRKAPAHPKVVEEDQLIKHWAKKEIAYDVVAIQCSLGEFFTICRGLNISLYDLTGKEIASTHTGTTGLVGFEGLKRGTDYVARIVDDKYQGEIQIHAGRRYDMSGKRK